MIYHLKSTGWIFLLALLCFKSFLSFKIISLMVLPILLEVLILLVDQICISSIFAYIFPDHFLLGSKALLIVHFLSKTAPILPLILFFDFNLPVDT